MFKFLDKLALNKGLMLLLCSITLALLCVELCVAVKRGRLYARKVVTTAAQAIVIVAVMAGIGFLLSTLVLFFYKLKDRDAELMAKCNAGEISREECEAQLSRKYS